MVLPLADDNYDIVLVVVEVLTVDEVFVGDFGYVSTQGLEIVADGFIGQLATGKVVLMVASLVQVFGWVHFPLVGFGVEELVLVMSRRHFNVRLK